MNSKRSFFKRLAAVVAAVALAPEIAFAQKFTFKTPDIESIGYWVETSKWEFYESESYRQWRKLVLEKALTEQKCIEGLFHVPAPKRIEWPIK